MKILTVVCRRYYGQNVTDPLYYFLTNPLVNLGHDVSHFDHFEQFSALGVDGCSERFVEAARNGGYDLVIVQTSPREPIHREAIREATRHTPVVAWNSDDDWQWEPYTSLLAPFFTFMVTTYPHIFEANRAAYPNLVLSQWGCYKRPADFSRPKDLGFTFVGNVYGVRKQECERLRKAAGLRVFGPGARLMRLGLPYFRGVSRLKWLYGGGLEFEEVHDIWNRSHVSFTPTAASIDPNVIQIKSRIFEMGLSGTLMLTQHNPALERYYTSGMEFVSYQGMEDCIEKAKFYLTHEAERSRVAQAYRERTERDHLWEHRFVELFRTCGFA